MGRTKMRDMGCTFYQSAWHDYLLIFYLHKTAMMINPWQSMGVWGNLSTRMFVTLAVLETNHPKAESQLPCISLSQSLRTSWQLLKNAEPCTTSWFFQEMLHEWIGRMDTFWCWIPQTSKCLVTLQLDISQSRWRRWKLSIFNELSN